MSKSGISFAEIMDGIQKDSYPAWRYHAIYEPRIVHNTDQDQQAALEGWEPPYEPITSTPGLKVSGTSAGAVLETRYFR